jgi:hypothetical protein
MQWLRKSISTPALESRFQIYRVGWVGGDAEEVEAGIRAVSKDTKT